MRTVLVSWLCVVLAVFSPITLAWAPDTDVPLNDVSLVSTSNSMQFSPFEVHRTTNDSERDNHQAHQVSHSSAIINDMSHHHSRLKLSSEANAQPGSASAVKLVNHDCCSTDVTGSELMSLSCFMDCSALSFGLVMRSSQQLMRISQTFVTTEVPAPIDSLPSQRLRPPIR
ncbi:hypothetical protein [uncultured Umboniibacter sp.]|uniref:hypothetical protein n=1 Tax=uncultured Umboniibacter sp. TaxID=1798917 RepID=UPI0026160C33|nr:hypothetical protein [uncultured Umboniibacter sp.]